MAILFMVLGGMWVALVIAKIISDAYSAAELRKLKEQWNDIKVGGTD
jgi:hypothetical protein